MDNVVNNYYNNYDEEGRLFRDNSHKVEWITTMTYFDKFIDKKSYILDGCAGTGNYSFQLASQGHKVVASDIVPYHADLIREKQKNNPILQDIHNNDITNLSQYGDETFDVVLCMGAFYHIDMENRNRAMKECLRVLKPDGILAISYINNMAITMCVLGNNLENMEEVFDCYKLKSRDGVFLHMSPEEIEDIANTSHTKILAHVAADGMLFYLSDKINNAKEEDFKEFIKLHLMTCEDKSLLGYSLHGLIFLQKIVSSKEYQL